ncbi:hypothetical protein ASF23_07635 [Curtobacterium sp. Leaf261]|nr:hypothetical protein ASF23_07635 [Curtobacterium sp. Leaf261]
MRMLVDAQPDMECVGTALDGAAGLDLIRTERPDVVLLDLRMPTLNGLETMAALFSGTDGRSSTPAAPAPAAAIPPAPLDGPPRVVVLTTLRRDDAVLAALRAGAAAFLTKDAAPEIVLGTIRSVDAGSPPPTADEAVEILRAAGIEPVRAGNDETLDVLSVREREVFLLVAKGLSNAEITEALFLSDATVKSHVRAVLAKLALRNRIQVVILAHERGLVRA